MFNQAFSPLYLFDRLDWAFVGEDCTLSHNISVCARAHNRISKRARKKMLLYGLAQCLMFRYFVSSQSLMSAGCIHALCNACPSREQTKIYALKFGLHFIMICLLFLLLLSRCFPF